jgi:hypothetical protein
MRDCHVSGCKTLLAAVLVSAILSLAIPGGAAETEWLSYVCEEYGFQVLYPRGYDVIIARSRSETKSLWGAEVLLGSELHKVTFLEAEYDMWPGAFEILVLANEDRLALEEWVDRSLQDEDVALVEPDSGDASIFGVGEVTIDGHEVVRLHLFNCDHTGITLHVMNGGLVYIISFAGANPNDPVVERHKAVYEEMVGSFEFLP